MRHYSFTVEWVLKIPSSTWGTRWDAKSSNNGRCGGIVWIVVAVVVVLGIRGIWSSLYIRTERHIHAHTHAKGRCVTDGLRLWQKTLHDRVLKRQTCGIKAKRCFEVRVQLVLFYGLWSKRVVGWRCVAVGAICCTVHVLHDTCVGNFWSLNELKLSLIMARTRTNTTAPTVDMGEY